MLPHKIDFIVFGVPRSGTKALARALNLHEHVFCALERFSWRDDHARLDFPGSFLDTREISDRRDLEKIDRMRSELGEKGDLCQIGNKHPRYYFSLDRMNQALPNLKNIWIYRSPVGFMPSWNRREANYRTSRWARGQVGLFGFLELLVCIRNCLGLDKDVFLFPYEAGLNGSAQPVLNALDFLDAARCGFQTERFEKEVLIKRREGRSRAPLQSHEDDMLRALRVGELDEILAGHQGVMLSEVADDVRTYLEKVRNALPGAVDRAFRNYPGRAPTAYGAFFFARHAPELSTIIELMEGSQAIADLQRFGPLRRLESLVIQRWALKQHLAHVRLRR